MWPTNASTKYVATQDTVFLCAYDDLSQVLRKMRVHREKEDKYEKLMETGSLTSAHAKFHTLRLLNKHTHFNTSAGKNSKFLGLDIFKFKLGKSQVSRQEEEQA